MDHLMEQEAGEHQEVQADQHRGQLLVIARQRSALKPSRSG